MKLLSSTLIASMLLNGIILPVSALGVETTNACSTDSFTPDATTPAEITSKCGGDATNTYFINCKDTREKLHKWSSEYKELAQKACQKRTESISKINELTQSSSYAEVKTKAEQGIADINGLIEANKKIRDAIPVQSAQNVKALENLSNLHPTAAQFKASVPRIQELFKSPEELDTKPEGAWGAYKSSTSSITNVKNKADAMAQMNTLAQSQKFVKALMLEEKRNKEAISKLTEARDNAAKNVKETKTATDDKTKKDDGFSPMSLLPLAAPLASLLMQQKKQDSGLSDSTTPTNPYANQPPASAAGTSFDSKTGQNPTGMTIGSSKSPETGMNMPGENYAASSGALEPFQGDISNGAGDGKSSNMGAMGSYSANSGGGSSDSSGASATPGKDRKPANVGALPPAEDGLIGAGGGGNFGSHSAEASAESGSGMKDMLQDMESTLEDSPAGLFAEVENQNSPDGVAAENSESLFPRVRACLVRNLKKGFVLNGLGEKLPESESH